MTQALYAVLGSLCFALVPAYSSSARVYALALLGGASFDDQDWRGKYTYVLLIALTPFLLCLSAWLAKRIGREGRAPGSFLIYCALISAGWLVWQDNYWKLFIRQSALSPWMWVLFVLLIASATPPVARRVPPWFVAAINLILMVTGALLILSWQWFGIGSVVHTPVFDSHFDAVAYSVVQIAHGGTCLADVTPQYGCYGEFLAPLLRIVGSTTLIISLVFVGLQALVYVVIVRATRSLIHNPALRLTAIIFTILAIVRIWNYAHDPYFQYMPIRIVFPALSLLLLTVWQSAPHHRTALALGAFAGLSVAWNLDTGAVVALALGLFVGLSGCTAERWTFQALLSRSPAVLTYAGGCATVLLLFYGYLSWKSGSRLIPGEFLAFQTTFFGAGYGMLPLPPPPSLWTVWAAVAIAPLALLAVRCGVGPEDKRLEKMAYLATMSLGLGLYYLGRANHEVLALASWPSILLLCVLVDRAWPVLLRATTASRVAGVLILCLVLAVGLTSVASRIPIVYAMTTEHWRDLNLETSQNSGPVDLRFVAAHSHPGERVVILAHDQAALFADSGLQSALPRMSWIETLRKVDARQQTEQINDPRFTKLFLGYDICCGPTAESFTSWVHDAMPNIRRRYALLDWSDDGSLMYLEPRATTNASRNLFDVERRLDSGLYGSAWDATTKRSTTRWGQPVTFPHAWPFSIGWTFSADLRFSLSATQPPWATIITNHAAGLEGFTIEMDQPNTATLYLGVGDNLVTSPPFAVAPDIDHDLKLSSIDGRVILSLDGRIIFDEQVKGLAPSGAPLLTGGFYAPGREVRGTFHSLAVTGDVTTDPSR